MVQYAMKPQRIEISYKTIIFFILSIISVLFLWNIRELIFVVFICFMLMESLNPTISQLEKLKIPRELAILIIYLFILSIVSFSVASIIPIMVEETSGLIKVLPETLGNIQIFGTSAIDYSSQFKLLENLPSDIAKTIISLFSNVFSAMIVLVITFYLLLERKNFSSYSLRFFGKTSQTKIMTILQNLELRLGSWVNGEIILMLIVGLLSYLGYLAIGLNYAVPLAIIAGLLEIVPNIGPTISAILAGLIGLTISPLTGLLAVSLGIVIQQLENNLIVPKIMKEAVGLKPIITILTIAVGAKLAGIGGALLAVPIYLTIETILTVLLKKD